MFSRGLRASPIGISKLQFLTKKKYLKNFQLSVIKSLDPDPGSVQMLDPDAQHWFMRGGSFPTILSSNPWIRIRDQFKCWIQMRNTGSFPTIRLSLPRLRCDILVSSMRSSSSRPVSPSRW